MKRRILIVGIIILGIYFFLKLLGIFFFKSHKDKRAELIDFKPTESMKIKTSKPIFYYTDNKLYYSENGEVNFSKPIWNGYINSNKEVGLTVSVSPNSKYIAFDNNGSVKILNQNGQELANIKPVAKDMLDGRKSGKFWNSDFQWSKNSENLYLMNDRVWNGNYSRSKNKTTLYRISLNDNKKYKVIDLKEQSRNYYLDVNQNNLYYTAYDSIGESWLLKKVDLKAKKVTDSVKRNDDLFLINKDSIFVNFKSQIGHYLNDRKGITTQRKDSLCNTVLIENGSENLIFKGKCGYNAFKNWSYSYLGKNNAWFLPDDRFYMSFINSKNYNGTVIIDTENLTYRFYDKKITPFYSFTNNDKKQFIYTWGELTTSYKNDK